MTSATTSYNTQFFEPAWNIGMDLVRDAMWDNGRQQCTWLGNSMEPVEGKFTSVVRSFGNDLYSGSSGIAFFLAALCSVKQDPLLLKTIDGAIKHALSTVNTAANFGFYGGKPGIAASLIYCGEQLKRQEWIDKGLEILASLKGIPSAEHETDIISGVAGTIPCLISFSKQYNQPVLLEIATAMGNELCERAAHNSNGWSWTTIPGTNHLTGYSHGTAGIATSLLQLYTVTQEEKFLEAAEGGFQYELTHFNTAKQNWPDFRENFPKGADGNYVCGNAWCHGAPGIALSRVVAATLKANEEYSRVATIALDTTLRELNAMLSNPAYNSNYSLCHGVAGNADILLESGREQDKAAAIVTGLAGIERFDKPRLPWPSGTQDNKRTPGLMMGAAGTGHFYLRLFDQQKFKTILLPWV
jgi:lantibiotic modifying enzyme